MLNDQVWIGDTFYTQFGIANQPPVIGWIKARFPTDKSPGLLGTLDESRQSASSTVSRVSEDKNRAAPF